MIFIDTGFLFAIVSKRDAHQWRVVEVFQTFKDLRLVDHLLTTNHAIAETITLTRKIGHDDAAMLGDQLYGEKGDVAASVRLSRRSTPARRRPST